MDSVPYRQHEYYSQKSGEAQKNDGSRDENFLAHIAS